MPAGTMALRILQQRSESGDTGVLKKSSGKVNIVVIAVHLKSWYDSFIENNRICEFLSGRYK